MSTSRRISPVESGTCPALGAVNGSIGTAGVAIGAYLLGSIPSGLILGRAFAQTDVRNSGSGNIGAANVTRVAGRGVGVLVLGMDLLKGLLPVLLGRLLLLDPVQLALIAGLTVIGHDFSLFLRFRGGKGVATTLGASAALAVAPTAAAAFVWVVLFAITRVSSIGSLVALWTLALFMAVFDQPPAYVWLAFALSVLSVYTHRDNIARLSRGQENRVGAS